MSLSAFSGTDVSQHNETLAQGEALITPRLRTVQAEKAKARVCTPLENKAEL